MASIHPSVRYVHRFVLFSALAALPASACLGGSESSAPDEELAESASEMTSSCQAPKGLHDYDLYEFTVLVRLDQGRLR